MSPECEEQSVDQRDSGTQPDNSPMEHRQMSEESYDYDGYEKSLERILAMTEKDYWTQYVDINRHQVNVGKTYLWVSAALLGAYAAAYSQFEANDFSLNSFEVLMFLIGIVLAISAFGICLYAIPARKGYLSIANPSWGEFSQMAYTYLCDKKHYVYSNLINKLIDRTDICVHHNANTNQSRAKQLRVISWVLIASLSFSLLAATSVFMSKFEIKMPITQEEKNYGK